MALQGNRVYVRTATTGTGTVTLGAVLSPAFTTFAEAGIANGSIVQSYCIEEGTNFEIGTGTYTSAGTTLSRTTVFLSKIAGVSGTTKMTLAGSATVRVIAAAGDIVTTAGDSTMTGNLTMSGPGPTINLTGVNAGMEIGQLAAVNTPFLDFHSGLVSVDYDARIIGFGGTGVSGGGTIRIDATTVELNSTTAALSATTGALTVAGGAGVNGALIAGQFISSVQPYGTANYDCSFPSVLTVANGSSNQIADLGNFSFFLVILNQTSGEMGTFMLIENTLVTLVSGSSANVLVTTAPAGGKWGVGWSGSTLTGFRVYNNIGSSADFRAFCVCLH